MPTDPTFIATLTEVANLALSKLGERQKDFLSNAVFDDNTGTIAEACQQHMYISIRQAQTDYRWDVLFVSVVIATPEDLTEDPSTPWSFRYPLPDDFVAPQYDDTYDYEIQANYIYCDIHQDLTFKYRRYSIDPSEWPQTLMDVVIGKLAIAICLPITENGTKYNALLTEYETIIEPRASRVDAYSKKQPNNRRKHGTYAQTRAGGYGYGRRLF